MSAACLMAASPAIRRAPGASANGLPASGGPGGGARASSRQLAGVDAVVWDETGPHKE